MTDDAFREPPWMCARCGYLMDAAIAFDDGDGCVTPADGDLSLCMNCALPYVRAGIEWRVMTTPELLVLPAPLRRKIAQASVAVWLVRSHRGTDLSKRGGRT